MNHTTIAIEKETHQRLSELKQDDKESFDSLVRRLLEQH